MLLNFEIDECKLIGCPYNTEDNCFFNKMRIRAWMDRLKGMKINKDCTALRQIRILQTEDLLR